MLIHRLFLFIICLSFFFTKIALAAPQVQFETNMGQFVVELDTQRAPLSSKNFLEYVASKHYNGTLFHRVISNFMVQGGGYNKDMAEKPTRPPILLESKNGLKNIRGSIAMARTADPNSATSQFFINVVDNSALDYPQPDGYGYAVFGKVISGMDTIDKIRYVNTAANDIPTTPVIIETAKQISQ